MARVKVLSPEKILQAYLQQHGLKASKQRDIIAGVFFNSHGHLRIEDVLQKARSTDTRISQATVYRTMKLLVDCGLCDVRTFLDGQTRYEIRDQAGGHHDHLICLHCAKIVEFCDPRIEALQDSVAGGYGFNVLHHKMELYGLCQNCQALS